MANQVNSLPASPQRTFLGHPLGLYVLFLTQMWERFSYFGMLALLIIYLNKYMKLPSSEAATVFKWYTSLIYFTPLLGGYLADRVLGNKRAVVIGATLMAIGHFLMTFTALSCALFRAHHSGCRLWIAHAAVDHPSGAPLSPSRSATRCGLHAFLYGHQSGCLCFTHPVWLARR